MALGFLGAGGVRLPFAFVVLGLGSLLPVRECLAQSRGPAELVDLVLRTVTVEATKPSGESWDPLGGKPDLRVHVQCGTKRYKSPVKTDVYTHDFLAKAMRVRAGETVEFVVRDKDATADDEIGRTTLMLTTQHIQAGRAVVAGFGRVRQLAVEFRR